MWDRKTNAMKFLVSTKMSVVLLLLLAISMAVATFVENDFGTLVAREFIYEAFWFELIIVWLSVNFGFHIATYNLFSKSKLWVGLLHLAFIIVVIGAGVTRYFGKEGMVHIRENQTVNEYVTNEKYIQFQTQHTIYYKQSQPTPYFFSPETLFVEEKGRSFECVLTDFIPKATPQFVEGSEIFLDVTLVSSDGQDADILLKKGEIKNWANLSLGFESTGNQVFKIQKKDSIWQLFSEIPLHSVHLENQQMGSIAKNTWAEIKPHIVYRWGEESFMVNAIHENKKLVYSVQNQEKSSEKDIVKIEVRSGGKTIHSHFFNAKKNQPEWQWFDFEGEKYAYAYASKQVKLPFSLKLNRFDLKRYPGSESAESYTSHVEVTDGDEKFSYQVYMNNVLDYKGHRFYQSSYDKDEKGTLLSLNKDRVGGGITYLGYGVLFLSMFMLLFSHGSRFGFLNRKLKKIKKEKITCWLWLIFPVFVFSQSTENVDKYVVNRQTAEEYGKLVVQDLDGRMKPLTTLAYEIARKLTGKTSVELTTNDGKHVKLCPEQFLLALQMFPEEFSHIPLIKINPEKAAQIYDILGVTLTEKLSFNDFINPDGAYKLKDIVEKTHRLKPSERSENQKELLKVDERFNILYNLFAGNFLRLYPNKKASNNKWFTGNQIAEFDEEDAIFVKNIHPLYLSRLQKGIDLGDFSEAEEALSYLKTYQKEAGKAVYPSDNELEAEIFYTRSRIGNYLFAICVVLGSILLITNILSLFFKKQGLQTILKIGSFVGYAILLVFTFDLGLRWYIAKHPPWSDGFEMLLFVSWGILLFGLFFVKKSSFTLPLGLLFSGTLLFVSFLDWLNPEITTLKPVLYSYWLKIHVTVIVGSYAPLGLSFVMAMLSLLLLIFKPKNPTKKWWQGMQEILIVQEMAVTIGLFLLTAGTFLGGIWANESWGRYWAWDPKETWALISILVYATLVHLRLIPAFRNALVYHLATMWAFSTIIMTSFGVNYYLVGLHSYATGDPVPIPKWVYFAVLFLVVISIYASVAYRKLSQEDKKRLSI